MSVQIPLFEKTEAKGSKVAAAVEEIVGQGFGVRKFVENFEVLIEANGGARSLRKLILELAIRGQLSAGHSDDDSARRLFDAAHSDRVGRQSRGEARQMEELAEPGADEVPFALPSSWLWTRIGLAVNLVNGRAFKPKDWSTSGLPIIRIQNLNNPDAPHNYCAFEVEPKHHLRPGDFLISWSGTPGTSFGAFIWNGPAGVLNQHIFRAEVYGAAYELGFLKIAINARLDEMIAQAHGGVGLQHITKGKLEALAIPLPPLAEQKRIVAKVDQLMALYDELEDRQTKKRETGDRLTKSALEALTTAEGTEELEAAWSRVVENFDVLIDRAEKVGEVRRAILELAASGQLVRPEAGSAAHVRSTIERPGGSSGTTPPSDWTEERGWLQGSLGGVLREPLANGRSVPDAVSGFPVLRLSALRGRFIDFSEQKVGAWSEEQATPFIVREGDVLFVRGNGAIRLVGRACLVGSVPEPVAFPDTAIRARLRPDVMDSRWLWYVWESRLVRQQVEAAAKTTAGIFKVSQDVLSAIRLPVPTLPEQRRIVDKLEQLMNVCDLLEERLRQAEDRASKLVEAVVQELVA